MYIVPSNFTSKVRIIVNKVMTGAQALKRTSLGPVGALHVSQLVNTAN